MPTFDCRPALPLAMGRAPAPMRLPPPSTARPLRRPEAASLRPADDQQALDALREACRESGGLLGGEELAARLRDHADQPLSLLARWIVSGEVLSIEWRSQVLIPLFQFDLATMTIRPEVADLMAELSPVFDGRELATWFALPNAWLQGATPVQAFASDPAAVRHAARADRFVATGWA